MVYQVLISLKKEAPWLFNKIPREDLDNLIEHYSSNVKQHLQNMIDIRAEKRVKRKL